MYDAVLEALEVGGGYSYEDDSGEKLMPRFQPLEREVW